MRLSFLLLSLAALSFSPRLCADASVASAQEEVEVRETPDYDGRGGERLTIGSGLLLLPRLALFPFYLATEYGFHRPLRWLGRKAELNDLPLLISDLFKFGEERQYTLIPTALIDFGFRASFGFVFKAKNFLVPSGVLGVRVATGGTDYGIAKLTYEGNLSSTDKARLSAELSRRPDFIFQSMGPLSQKELRYRYGAIRKEGALAYATDSFLGGSMDLQAAIRDLRFLNGTCCGEPGIDKGVADGIFPTPPRYRDGYSSFAQRLHLNWGDRVSRPAQRSGAILDLTGDHSFDLAGGGWWIYGGAVTGYFDLNGYSRVVSLKVEAEVSEPQGGKDVPFNELPSLGGTRLPGFLDRRFIGSSVFAATMEYKWPVLSVVDGVIHFGVGNVFGQGLKGLKLGWLRKSIGFGLDATGAKSSPFGLLFAFGSKAFDEGGQFNEFRFSLRVGG